MLDSVASNFSICMVWLVWLVASVQVLGLPEARADLLSACMGEAVCIAVLADARSKGAFASAACGCLLVGGVLPNRSDAQRPTIDDPNRCTPLRPTANDTRLDPPDRRPPGSSRILRDVPEFIFPTTRWTRTLHSRGGVSYRCSVPRV